MPMFTSVSSDGPIWINAYQARYAKQHGDYTAITFDYSDDIQDIEMVRESVTVVGERLDIALTVRAATVRNHI